MLKKYFNKALNKNNILVYNFYLGAIRFFVQKKYFLCLITDYCALNAITIKKITLSFLFFKNFKSA